MEDSRFQDGVDIDFMLPASILYKYANIESNKYSCPPFMNGKTTTIKNSSVSTFTSTSITSKNDEICSLQNKIH